MTYNGHGMDEFIPHGTSAYISQHDVHIGEMTVRETLAFSARCQGVGPRYGMLSGNWELDFYSFSFESNSVIHFVINCRYVE